MRLVFAAAVIICAGGLAGGWELPGDVPDTSRQALTPQWAFEVWMWEDDVNTADAVWDMVRGCEEHDLPLRAVIIDSPWATAYNNFTWDERRYPEPQRLIDELHARGVKVVCWMTCMINLPDRQADAPGSDEDLYAIAKDQGYLANDGGTVKWWKGEGAYIDYTNPAAVAWWRGLMDRALLMGIDGWKVDGAEPYFARAAGGELTGGFGKAGPISIREYGDMYYRDTYHHLLSRNPAGVTVVRSCDTADMGYTGRFAPLDAAPVTWFGDQRHTWDDKGILEAIADQFRAMDKGYSVMGADIGGYQSAGPGPLLPVPLYTRWLQWSTFLPFFLNGGHGEHRPWKYDRAFLDLYRRFAWTHQELAPYYYSRVRDAHLGRGAVMKTAPGAYQYTIGDEFLVAIIHEDVTTRRVVFPEGDWIDYFDNARTYRGPGEADLEVPDDRYPAFIRSGSIIPLNVVNAHAGHGDESSVGALTLDIYPDPARAASFRLWDEATGMTDLSCSMDDRRTRLVITGAGSGAYILRMRLDGPPRAVRCGERARLEQLDHEQWRQGRLGWRYDEGDRRLWVRLRAVGDTTVEIERARGRDPS